MTVSPLKSSAPSPLKSYNVLIADADQQLSTVVRDILRKMGFENIRITHSGTNALRIINEDPVDFLITEWNTRHVKGIDVVKQIRHDPNSANPLLPIIMLTGRAEKNDVQAARDYGINEYVVKPFSARTIYSRLERIIDHPRPFVVSNSFIGPDRRHKGNPPPGTAERRVREVKPQKAAVKEKNIPSTEPQIWESDYALKNKLGIGKALPDYVTEERIDIAQKAIEEMSVQSLEWLKDNLSDLEITSGSLNEGTPAEQLEQLNETALMVNSRAGTFGYTRASEVAYKLHLFCQNQLDPAKDGHQVVVQKHVDVLRAMFAANMKGDGGTEGELIVSQLDKLVNKLAS